MENLEIILSLAGTCVGLVVTAATFIVKFIKNAKAKIAAEQTINICNAIMPYIKQAENYADYSGAEKKAYVMTKANQYAIEKGMRFDKDTISDKIEELITLSKEVNVRGKRAKNVIVIPSKS